LKEELSKYKNASVVWCQEEHRNMGAWSYAGERINIVCEQLGKEQVSYVGRGFAASPAVGSSTTHKAELEAFLTEAFA